MQLLTRAPLEFSEGILKHILICLVAALGAIFGCTTCLSTHIREAPDDPLNYFIGGCASGIFLGARSK